MAKNRPGRERKRLVLLDRLFYSRPAGAIPAILCGVISCGGALDAAWGGIGLGLDLTDYVFAAAITGAVGGLLGAQYRLPGLIAGALVGAGGLLAVYLFLSSIKANAVRNIVVLLVWLIGAIPGGLIYYFAERHLSPPTEPDGEDAEGAEEDVYDGPLRVEGDPDEDEDDHPAERPISSRLTFGCLTMIVIVMAVGVGLAVWRGVLR
jgi:hypothetical protein